MSRDKRGEGSEWTIQKVKTDHIFKYNFISITTWISIDTSSVAILIKSNGILDIDNTKCLDLSSEKIFCDYYNVKGSSFIKIMSKRWL